MPATLALVAIFDFGLLVRRSLLPVMSPFDEGYHLSYVQYVYQWSIPRVGDPLQSWGQQAYSCHLTFPYGVVTDVPCGRNGDPSQYPEQGSNTAAGWPPLYYLFAAQFVRVLCGLGRMEPLHAARIASCLLWAVGCLLLAWLVQRVSGSLLLSAGVGVIACANPAAWALGSYVTPHSTALLVGSVLLGVVLWVAGPHRPPPRAHALAIVVSLVIALTLPHSIVAVATMCLALLFIAWHRRPHSLGIVSVALALGITNLVVYVFWRVVVAWTTVGPAAVQSLTRHGGLIGTAIGSWDLFVPRLLSDVAFASPMQNLAAHVMGYFVLALLGHWLLISTMPNQRALALAVVIVAPLAALYLNLSVGFAVPPRYGASLMPLLLFLVTIREPPRWFGPTVALLAFVLVVVAWEGTDSYLFMLG